MKVLILAGGLGSRLSEETVLKPKPMVEIGGHPILWHIMKCYSYYGFNDFVILTGYKSHVIKEYFVNYYQQYSDLTVDLATNTVSIHKTRQEPWKVTMLYTGQNTLTGSRIKKAKEYINNERFMLTYGDGVSDVDINALLKAHETSGKLVRFLLNHPIRSPLLWKNHKGTAVGLTADFLFVNRKSWIISAKEMPLPLNGNRLKI